MSENFEGKSNYRNWRPDGKEIGVAVGLAKLMANTNGVPVEIKIAPNGLGINPVEPERARTKDPNTIIVNPKKKS